MLMYDVSQILRYVNALDLLKKEILRFSGEKLVSTLYPKIVYLNFPFC